MLNKIIATAGFACLAQNVRAQEEDTSLAVIPDTVIPEGELGAEVPVGEEMTEETFHMEGEEKEGHEEGDEDGMKSHDDHEGHDDHEDHSDHKHQLSSSCLLKSAFQGSFIPESDISFDYQSTITTKLMAHHSPFQYYACIDRINYYLTSLQITFADEDGADLVKMPLIGPEGGEGLLCASPMFNDRGSPTEVRIFMTNSIITGLGILYPGGFEDVVLMGEASKEVMTIVFEKDQALAGFYGATLKDSLKITQLGVIIQDTACTDREIEEMLAIQKLTIGESVDDDENSSVGLIVAIVVIVLIIIAIILAVLFICLRKRKQDKVQFFGDPNQPPTSNNSQALPEIATEDGLIDTKRSANDLMGKMEQ